MVRRLASMEEENQRLVEQNAELRRSLNASQVSLSHAHANDANTRALKAENESMALLIAENEAKLAHLAELNSTLKAEKRDIRKHNRVLRANGEELDNELKALRERMRVLEEENYKLKQINDEMMRFAGGGDDSESQSIARRKPDHREESEVLKTKVVRLSAELGKYQSKYGALSGKELSDLPGLPLKGPKPQWLVNIRQLSPLIAAYDDQLMEKDKLVKHYEKEFAEFQKQLKDVVKENERLHLRIEQTDISGPTSMTVWRQLQEHCKLVLEENQLLMEQLDVQQGKTSDLHTVHVHEVAKLSKQLLGASAERDALGEELKEWLQKYDKLKQEHYVAVTTTASRMTMEEHVTAVTELKKLLDDEKASRVSQLQNLNNKLDSVTLEKAGLGIEVDELRTANRNSEAEIRALNKAQRKSHKKIVLLQKILEETKSMELTAEQYLNSVIRVAEKTAAERDSYAKTAQDHQREKKRAHNKLMEGIAAVGKLEEKIKLYKQKMSEKMEKASQKLNEKDADQSALRQEYDQEMMHLRLLLQEKDQLLAQATADKKQVENDLEVTWQAATNDNRRMNDMLRKSFQKLRQHGQIIGAMELGQDNMITMLETSD